MKRILVLVFITFFLLGFLLIFKEKTTYAYEDCHNKKLVPKEVTTLNLALFVNENNYELISFCSFDMCYVKREDNVSTSINNFNKYFNSYLSEDDYNELNIKGYPITEIVVNAC